MTQYESRSKIIKIQNFNNYEIDKIVIPKFIKTQKVFGTTLCKL